MEIKRTPKTYISIAIFLAVFGNLIYQIVKDSSSSQPTKEGVVEKKFSVDNSKLQQEPYTLKPISRDPFLGTVKAQSKPSSSPITSSKSVVWPNIQYGGLISDGKSRTKIFVLTIDGKQNLLKIGEQIDNVRLLRGTSEKVWVRFEGSTKEFSI